MIHAFTCLLFPLIGGCAPYVDYHSSVSGILARPAYYASKPVMVSGTVRSLRRLSGSSFGTLAETFELCDGGCIMVFKREHTDTGNGKRLSVRGIFLMTDRIGKHIYHEDIEANEILSRN